MRWTRLVLWGYIGALMFAAYYNSILGACVASLGGALVVAAELRR